MSTLPEFSGTLGRVWVLPIESVFQHEVHRPRSPDRSQSREACLTKPRVVTDASSCPAKRPGSQFHAEPNVGPETARVLKRLGLNAIGCRNVPFGNQYTGGGTYG